MTECSDCKIVPASLHEGPKIQFCPLHAKAAETAAENKRLREVNSQMLEALRMVAQNHKDQYFPPEVMEAEINAVDAAIQAAQAYGGLNR